MHSTVHTPMPAPTPFKFPGIFRVKMSGSLWLARSATYAIRIAGATTPEPDSAYSIGVAVHECDRPAITPENCEQVTSDVTITFHLP